MRSSWLLSISISDGSRRLPGRGPPKYLSELEEWRHENRGLAYVLAADTLIRKKIYKLNRNKRKDFPNVRCSHD